MPNLTRSEDFSRYGVRVNPTAAVVYARTAQGRLVLVCRHDGFRRPLKGVLAYVAELAEEAGKIPRTWNSICRLRGRRGGPCMPSSSEQRMLQLLVARARCGFMYVPI